MNRKICSIVLIVGLCCSAALAQQQDKKTGQGISEWLKALQQKIAQLTPKKSIALSTSVAGVRAAKEDAQTKLYWKGKKGDDTVTEEEMAEFKTAIEITASGDQAAAVKELEKFMTKYPDSALIPDAKKTLDLMKGEAKEGTTQ